MITFTEAARNKILSLMKSDQREGLALRFAIQGRRAGGFLYRLAFVEAADRKPSDTVVDAGGFEVFVDDRSAPSLDRVSVDHVEDARGGGFKIDNPNPLWSDPKALAVQDVIDNEINPALGGHGGWVTLLEVKDDVVYVQLGGGCQGCGMADATLKHGVEARLREAIPGIREVIDTTDHADGTNPYYQPARG
jgi:Fe/S biogenesis protein NfuA